MKTVKVIVLLLLLLFVKRKALEEDKLVARTIGGDLNVKQPIQWTQSEY